MMGFRSVDIWLGRYSSKHRSLSRRSEVEADYAIVIWSGRKDTSLNLESRFVISRVASGPPRIRPTC